MENYKVSEIVAVFDRIADAIYSGAQHLGTNNAATQMGAIEMLASEVKDGLSKIADGLQAIAAAIQEENNDG
jgi:hypothetical protein